MFTTLLKAGGGEVPSDRQIDGIDMHDFLLGKNRPTATDAICACAALIIDSLVDFHLPR
jgi:hypothetical protein